MAGLLKFVPFEAEFLSFFNLINLPDSCGTWSFTESLNASDSIVCWNRQNKIKQLIVIRSLFTDYTEMFYAQSILKAKPQLEYASSTFICVLLLRFPRMPTQYQINLSNTTGLVHLVPHTLISFNVEKYNYDFLFIWRGMIAVTEA